MKKKLLIVALIVLIIGVVVGRFGIDINKSYVKVPIIRSEPQTLPYIENDVLYTEKRILPLAYITHIMRDNRTVNYMIIEWSDGNHSGGIFSMSMVDFEKISPELERYYAKKR